MNGKEHIAVEDLAMFALLLLSEEDAAVVRTHQDECALCREELKQVREDLATYALAVEPVEPPQGSRERFLARLGEESSQSGASEIPAVMPAAGAAVFGTPTTKETAETATAAVKEPRFVAPVSVLEPAVRRQRSGAARVLPYIGWLGWAAAAAAIVVAVGLKQDRDALASALGTEIQQATRLQAQAESVRHILGTLTDPSAVRVNLTVPKAPSTPTARATYEQKSGTLLLLASNLAPLQPQKVYELWLIPADGSKPVAAGTFSPDAHGNASLLVSALKGAVAAKAFGITVEPAGGSVTPTMPILLAGTPA